MEQDEGVYLTVARFGGLPYTTVFDHKPPLIYGWYHLASLLSGNDSNLEAVRILAACQLSAAALGVAWIGWLVAGRTAGLVAGLLMALATSNQFLQFNANTEVFMLPPLVLGTGAFVHGVKHGKKRWFVLSGMLLGAATMTKPVGLLHLAALIFVLRWAIDARLIDVRTAIRCAALLMGGTLIVCAGTVAPWLFTGHLREFWFANITYNLEYSQAPPIDRIFALGSVDERVVIGSLWLWCLAAYGGATLARERLDMPRAAILASAAAAIAGASVTGREYAHYWVPLVPFAALIAGIAIVRIAENWPDRRTSVPLAALVLLTLPSLIVIANLYGESKEGAHLSKYHGAGPIAVRDLQSERVAGYIADHTSRDDRVFVFGLESELYALADRRPATYFTRPIAAFGVDDDSFERTMHELVANPPALIVDAGVTQMAGDAGPSLVASGQFDVSPKFRGPFDRFVADHYEFLDRIAYARVYRLKQAN